MSDNYYSDNFMSIEADQESGIGFYCDMIGEHYFISILMARHIIKRFNQYKTLKNRSNKDFQDTYKILDFLKTIKNKREY